MKLMLILIAVAVSGCAQLMQGDIPRARLKDPAQNLMEVNCSGPANTFGTCYQAADRTCKQGYEVTDKVDRIDNGGTRILTFKCK